MKKVVIILLLSFIISSPALAIRPHRWKEVFSGYGYTKVDSKGVTLKPKNSTASSETHAALVIGPKKKAPLYYKISVKTKKQLRENSEPNNWEAGWVVWNYTGNDYFYYFILKPKGWELGKRDPAYEGGQRFLATGGTEYPINNKYRLRIKQRKNNTIYVYLGQKLLVRFRDKERPYISGRVGVYSEDAKVRFSNIKFK